MEWSESTYAAIANLISSEIGISFPESRRSLTEQSIAAVWRRAGAPSALAYLADLVSGAAPIDDLVNELVVGETYFFRDPAQFALLQDRILPELRDRLGHGLSIWSAGCASGEEAYSLAIAASASAAGGAADRVYASDVSAAAIAAARRGVYGAWSMRGVPPELIDRIAVRRDKSYVVRDRWRRVVEFAHGNLAAAEAPPAFPARTRAMDVILCRNVLIYLDEAAVRRAAELLYSALAEGGYLLTAPSDPLLWGLAPFTTVMTSAGIVYRRLDVAPRRDSPSEWAGATAAIVAAPPLPAPPPRPAPEPRRAEVAPAPALARAERSFAAGEWEAAARLTAGLDDPAAAAIHVRALANARGTAEAERACAEAAARHPTSAELHHVRAVLLLALDRLDDAAAAARSALFLDPRLSAGHFVLATIAHRAGDLALARRSYRNAHALLRGERDDAPVALADGQRVGALRRAALAALAGLDAGRGARGADAARTAR